eukprot:856172-Pelagomonas_calceolata.AAC.2
MTQILECRPDYCSAIWAMLLEIKSPTHPVQRLDLACCVHGYWTDALHWRGTAGFLLQGPGELTHTWASLLAGLTELTHKNYKKMVLLRVLHMRLF